VLPVGKKLKKKNILPFGRLYATLYILLYRNRGKNNFLVKVLSFETIQVKILAWGLPQIAFINCIFVNYTRSLYYTSNLGRKKGTEFLPHTQVAKSLYLSSLRV